MNKKQEAHNETLNVEGQDPIDAALRHKVSKIHPDATFVNRLAIQLRAARASLKRTGRIPAWGWMGAAVAVLLLMTFVIQALWSDNIPATPGEPTPTTTGRTAGPVPTDTLTPPPGSPTPEIEPDFAASLPPAVATIIPRPGEEVNTAAGVLVRFTQPMDRASVEQALQVNAEGEAPLEGDFTWDDDQIVTFKPKGLASGVRYQVTLGTEARATNGLPLNRELLLSFSTESALAVTHTSPADGTGDLPGDVPLLVAFNYPVVPINCSGQVAESNGTCPALPLDIRPAVVGQGMWVNSSVYRLDPLPAWDAGMTYSVTLPAGITGVAGSMMTATTSFSFSTALPVVMSVEPANGDVNILLETDVRVHFNTAMDRAAAEAAFALLDPQEATVPGTLAWEDNGTTLIFTPTQYLATETSYAIAVGADAKSLAGTPLESERWDNFTTIPALQVADIFPRLEGGARRVEYYSGANVTFDGALDPESLSDHVQITQSGEPVEDIDVSWGEFEGRYSVYVSWEKDPGVEYCLQLLPGIADHYGNALAEELSTCFVVNDMPSLLVPYAQEASLTLDAAEVASVYFVAVNADHSALTLSSVPSYRFFSGVDTPMPTDIIKEWSITPGGVWNESTVVKVDLNDGEPLPTGFYLLNWDAPGEEYWWLQFMRFAVVDRHLTLKMGDDEALVWVTDLRSGIPVAGVEVLLVSESGREFGRSVSDADGVARFSFPQKEDLGATFFAVTGEAGGAGFGVVGNNWNSNTTPWDFDVNYYYQTPSSYRGYLHIDRPIYRPGQDVYFRGVLRNDDDGTYTLPPAGLSLDVRLSSVDRGVGSTQTISVTLTEMGTFEGHFSLPDDVALGQHVIRILTPDSDVIAFNEGYIAADDIYVYLDVAAYRKPEFEVLVTPEQDNVLDGTSLRALVEARYYAGGAAGGARVHWRVLAQPYTFSPEDSGPDLQGWWTWDTYIPGWDYWMNPEVIAEGDALTDGAGNLLLELPADLEPLGDQETVGAQSWELEVTVTDESNFPVTGRGEVNVHSGRFYLGLKPRDWVVQAGNPASVDVATLDWDSQPFPDQPLTLSLAQREWQHTRSYAPGDRGTWTYTDTVIETISLTTGGTGRAEATFTPPKSGAYVILAEGTDAGGNQVRSETSLWVGGNEVAAWKQAEGKVVPVADAESYQPGNTAHILLPTPFDGPYEVLMTLERESFLDVQRFTVTEANPIIEVPITDAYVPNVVVSFVLVKGVTEQQTTPDVRIGMVELVVEPLKQRLNVEVVPDCTARQSLCTYAPGDTVTLTIRATNYSGAPADAEVALAVVDKAVLALSDDTTFSIVDAFYAPRPLTIFTGDSLLVSHNRSTANVAAMTENADQVARETMLGGLGGGGGGGEMIPQIDVRQDFPDTALWEAQVRTGPTGETSVTFDLPDSLTTWVADARAVTADTLVGQSTAEFVVSKPLLVRPVTPRFLTAGDRAEVAAIVHNNTDSGVEAKVWLETNLQIDGAREQQVSVPAGGRARVSWHVLVTDASLDAAELTFYTQGGGYSDAARPSVGRETDHALPIYRYESPDVMSTSGVLTGAGSRVEAIVVPPEAGPDSTLTVRVSPSLAAGMTESLSYLEHFEYECNEQLISRFLPNVMTYRALRDLEQSDPELEAKLQALVEIALSKLYARQNADGGWGWWGNDRSQMQVTAYAALGMIEAQRAGFPVESARLEVALDRLQRAFSSQSRLEDPLMTDAYILYVLAQAGEALPEGVDTLIFEHREDLGVVGRSYLALAFGLSNPDDPRVETLLEELRAEAVLGASGAHWEQRDSVNWITWTRATATVIDALARLAPDDPLLPQAVRWLMVARRADRWETTQETAWAVMALTDFMVAGGELRSDYDWSMAFNTEMLADESVTQENLRQTLERVIPVSVMLREWPNALEISRGEGNGTLYYTADLSVYLPADQLSAENNGFTVERQYCAAQPTSQGTPSWYGEQADFGPCAPLDNVQPGDLVEVRLNLTLAHDRQYVMLEDPYPAGMEPVDSTLNTEQSNLDPEAEPVDLTYPWWWPSFSHQELRDERAVFFSAHLASGSYQVRYYLRAAVPGTYKVLPTTVSEMYFPDVWGRSEGTEFVIEP